MNILKIFSPLYLRCVVKLDKNYVNTTLWVYLSMLARVKSKYLIATQSVKERFCVLDSYVLLPESGLSRFELVVTISRIVPATVPCSGSVF